LIAETWLALRGESGYADVPPAEPSLGLIGEALLDRAFTLGTSVMTGLPRPGAVRRMLDEAALAERLFAERGWLAEPALYHPAPPALSDPRIREESSWAGHRRQRYRRLVFASGYAPHPGEPGRERWLAHPSNGTAHAYALEHEGGPRPWIVCVHGFGMGTPLFTLSGFPIRLLHEVLGLNVLLPCLPLHGVRGSTRLSGGEILAPDYLRLVHLFAQGVWDVRRLLSWIRARGGDRVGLYGLSLGGYISALVAGLDPDLACVVAGIPMVDFPLAAQDNMPWLMRRYDDEFELDWRLIRTITHVVSPLALRPLVPRAGRFIYAGIADRVVKPEHPRALWRHWDEPAIHWFSGGHVLGAFNRSVQPFLAESLRSVGMTA
jgi:pimeloyl-ACP methyl ester carboxylesterase